MNDEETDELVKMLAFIAKEEAKTLSTQEVERMLIHGCKGWIDQPVEEVRKRYQKLARRNIFHWGIRCHGQGGEG